MSISGPVAACDPFPTVEKEVAGCASITAPRIKAADVMAMNLPPPPHVSAHSPTGTQPGTPGSMLGS